MKNNQHYPQYISYAGRKQRPSVLAQEYPLPSLDAGEIYYPENKLLDKHFNSEKEKQMFGAAEFISFLNDTIEVEHNLVIPAIASIRRLPFKLPAQPVQDLFKTATDEAFHAEQSLLFLTTLDAHFDLPDFSSKLSPLFIHRLKEQIKNEGNPLYKQLLPVLNGIVTETRISIELGQFAKNHTLSDSVRTICRTHAVDEVVHASQFQALGHWLWEEFNETLKAAISHLYVNSTIARSLPDLDNIIIAFSRATGRSIEDSSNLVLSLYSEDILVDQMLEAAKPTFYFLKALGIENYLSIDTEIEIERTRLYRQLTLRRIQTRSKIIA